MATAKAESPLDSSRLHSQSTLPRATNSLRRAFQLREVRQRAASLPNHASLDDTVQRSARRGSVLKSIRKRFQKSSRTAEGGASMSAEVETSPPVAGEVFSKPHDPVDVGSEHTPDGPLEQPQDDHKLRSTSLTSLPHSHNVSAPFCSAATRTPPLSSSLPRFRSLPERPPKPVAPSTSSSAGALHRPASHAIHSEQDNEAADNLHVYENVAATVKAFQPMLDVGRWYSAYQERKKSLGDIGREGANGEFDAARPPPPLPQEASPTDDEHDEEEAPNASGGVYAFVHEARGEREPADQLTRGLRSLACHGWYWGPTTRQEAEDMLRGKADGTFLVRDSSDERYFVSLTFRSQGRTLHTRIEHHQGRFSFYHQTTLEESFPSIEDLIERSVEDSRDGAFCYSRGRAQNSQAFPVRLTTALSRFSCVRSLQSQCRFVIRQHTRYDLIRELPLPRMVKDFLRESQFS